jgi:hypothetical protein
VALEEKVPAAWLPKLDRTKAHGNRISARIPEYGCGAYGCVFPTLDKEIVLKVTTDSTEAEFAAQLAQHLPVPIVTAYRIVMLLPSAKRQGRKVYLLWRETAQQVGQIDKVLGDLTEDTISRQHAAAQTAFHLLFDGLPAQQELRAWRATVEQMGKLPDLRYLADGMLRAYDEQGVFFGDLHGGNLGLCKRGTGWKWVITDPGHVAVVQHEKMSGTAPAPAVGARSTRRTSEVMTIQRQNPRDPTYHAGMSPAEIVALHERMKADNALWQTLEFRGVQSGYNDDDERDPAFDIEVRDCPCGSSLGRVASAFPRVNPFGVGAYHTVMEAVERIPREEWFGDRNVFISDIYDQLVDDQMNNGMNLDEFKAEIIRLWRDGHVTLSRADYVAAMDPRKVERSEIDYMTGSATYHFVVIE